ncbi:family 1 glycosylhydrolase [Klebsiella pneumoniae subsp. pneumoniae]|nr:family 1 glycosylhydrolase [Klebsiella pneumoniae subsp. pneumoniae]
MGTATLTASIPPAVRDPARAIQACHHVFIAHALAVKAFREMAVAGEIGFVNVLQPHTPLTDSEADITGHRAG